MKHSTKKMFPSKIYMSQENPEKTLEKLKTIDFSVHGFTYIRQRSLYIYIFYWPVKNGLSYTGL